jgi:hypothetical protein
VLLLPGLRAVVRLLPGNLGRLRTPTRQRHVSSIGELRESCLLGDPSCEEAV